MRQDRFHLELEKAMLAVQKGLVGMAKSTDADIRFQMGIHQGLLQAQMMLVQSDAEDRRSD